MPTLTAIQSYLGWHIGIMVLIWGVFLIRFNRVAKGFFELRHDDSWEAQVLRWGIIIGLDVMIPALFAVPAFYYTGLVHPIGCLISASTWIGCAGFCTIIMLMFMLRFSSPCGCCYGRRRSVPHIGGPVHQMHGHPSNPNRRRHSGGSGRASA